MVELVRESGAESGTAVQSFGAVSLGEVRSTTAARSFGSGSNPSARGGNCCADNSSVGNNK
ncbi:MAG TPA: hypothetical protein VIX91_05680 [Candidatus Acidoferrum sp.]